MIRSRRALLWALGCLCLAAALFAMLRRAGSSPLLWIDTLNDERQVRNCLQTDCCELHGATVSFGSLVQGASWQQMRSALAVLGGGVELAHILWAVIDSLCVCLLLLAGLRLGFPWAGALAAAMSLVMLDKVEFTQQMVWNFRPLFSLSVLCLLLCLACIQRPRFLLAAAAAFPAALACNIHLAAAPLGLAVLFACLFPAGARLCRLLGAGLVLLAVCGLSSPQAWWHDLGLLLGGHWLPVPSARAGHVFYPVAIAGLAASAGLGLLACLPRLRGPALLLLAVALPATAAFVTLKSCLELSQTDRYLLPSVPAIALGLGLAAQAGLDALARRLPLLPELPRLPAQSAPVVAAAVVMMLIPPGHTDREDALQYRHLYRVADFTASRAWSQQATFRRLRGPRTALLLEGLAAERHLPGSDEQSDRTLYVWLGQLVCKSGQVLERSLDRSLVVAEQPAALDWGGPLEICASGTCEQILLKPSSERSKPSYALDHMPDPGHVSRVPVRLRLRVPLLRSRTQTLEVRLPQAPCGGGRILDLPPGAEVLAGGRAVLLPATVEGSLGFEWLLGSPACPASTYDGFLPPIVEGRPGEVGCIAAAMSGEGMP
ncbi:MAG: hypothetical protein JXR96_14985 [Deltaproteobacteria bacterium]|nr:hypothetical protein [Deltaproteobacteria bacterium]